MGQTEPGKSALRIQPTDFFKGAKNFSEGNRIFNRLLQSHWISKKTPKEPQSKAHTLHKTEPTQNGSHIPM